MHCCRQNATAALYVILLSAASFTWGQDTDQGTRQRAARRAARPELSPIEDRPGLPRVLLIGDSISIGYTLPVRQLLDGKANVHRPQTNCGPTTKGLAEIDQWLGDGKWDVIHFNWGLHDLKYMGPDGKNLADPQDASSHQQVSLQQYEQNLQQLVKRMKQTGASLIWCSTTPVPSGAQGRVVGDAVTYNEAAARIMAEHEVAIDDLYSFAYSRLKQIQRPANVHFTSEGSAELAQQVVKSIKQALQSRRHVKQ